MANQEHLKILKKGVEVWNRWRNTFPDQQQMILIDLSGASLSGTYLAECHLGRTIFSENTPSRKEFTVKVDLSHADLSDANFISADFEDTNLTQANLRGAKLYGANLDGANLSRANLSKASLVAANLSHADLTEADLSETNLVASNLARATLHETILNHATVGMTLFNALDLRTAKGLESIKHQSPSSIGFDTISRSQGDIPERFLQGVGLTDTQIAYIRSLVLRPIDYYTCFISYSSNDQNFVERLYADLQNKGVRCWFAPEDLKIGDHYHQRIDESIRLYDKLILILSEHAIQSAWVEREVTAAREKEDRAKRPVLFPVRLDDAVMTTTKAWAADIRRRWHIGDFTKWKEHDSYQKTFNRLLRDLKASPPQQILSSREELSPRRRKQS